MPKGVTDRDKGYKDLRRALAAVGRIRVVVGIRGTNGAKKGTRTRTAADGTETTKVDSIDLVGIASVHEYGTDDGHVPARPTSARRSTTIAPATSTSLRMRWAPLWTELPTSTRASASSACAS